VVVTKSGLLLLVSVSETEKPLYMQRPVSSSRSDSVEPASAVKAGR
jgi:hypothetical protein